MPVVKGSKKLNGWQLVNGSISPVKTGVVIEQEFPLYVNGKLLVTASITPTYMREFALGYLFGQGFINSPDEMASLEIINNTAQVTLKDKRKALTGTEKTGSRIVSGGGKTVYATEATLPEVKSDFIVSKRTIFSAMNKLVQNAPLYVETEGVHAAGLFNTRAMPLCIIEDIGRHNTLDKLIGYVLMHKVDCSRAILVSTGRMTSEMVTKIARCGIPITATKSAVTDRGLQIGQKCGLTIIGFVRDAGTKLNTDTGIRIVKEAVMKIYCGAARIRCA